MILIVIPFNKKGRISSSLRTFLQHHQEIAELSALDLTIQYEPTRTITFFGMKGLQELKVGSVVLAPDIAREREAERVVLVIA